MRRIIYMVCCSTAPLPTYLGDFSLLIVQRLIITYRATANVIIKLRVRIIDQQRGKLCNFTCTCACMRAGNGAFILICIFFSIASRRSYVRLYDAEFSWVNLVSSYESGVPKMYLPCCYPSR